MELVDVMRTTFAAREFTDDPLPDDVLYRILDNARFAPSGGNRQGWKVVVIRAAETRRELVRLIQPTMRRYFAQMKAGENPWNTIVPTRVTEEEVEKTEVPSWITDNVIRAPVVLAIAVDLGVVASLDRELDRIGVISGASIYPFAWNILLGARDLGYGGALTTFLAGGELEAQKLLGLPESYAVAALLPLGKPVKQLTRLSRKPVEEFAVRERWGGEVFRG